MSLEEMEEWRYFFSVEPTSENKIVHHIALQTAALLQTKGVKNVKLFDYLLDYDQPKKEKHDPKEVVRKLYEQIKGEL